MCFTPERGFSVKALERLPGKPRTITRGRSLRSEEGSPSSKRACTERFTPAAFILAVLMALFLVGGCGLQTGQANKLQIEANKHQHEAEAVFARLKALPGDWQNIFSTSTVNPTQVAEGRQLIQTRVADITSLSLTLKNWGQDNSAILKLNVDQKLKKYVNLKAAAIKQWQEYFEADVRPLVKAYGGLLETIARGSSLSEQEKAAEQITSLVSESLTKLQDCLDAQQKAQQYLKANNLGK